MKFNQKSLINITQAISTLEDAENLPHHIRSIPSHLKKIHGRVAPATVF